VIVDLPQRLAGDRIKKFDGPRKARLLLAAAGNSAVRSVPEIAKVPQETHERRRQFRRFGVHEESIGSALGTATRPSTRHGRGSYAPPMPVRET
jgi:hypothetical protein